MVKDYVRYEFSVFFYVGPCGDRSVLITSCNVSVALFISAQQRCVGVAQVTEWPTDGDPLDKTEFNDARGCDCAGQNGGAVKLTIPARFFSRTQFLSTQYSVMSCMSVCSGCELP